MAEKICDFNYCEKLLDKKASAKKLLEKSKYHQFHAMLKTVKSESMKQLERAFENPFNRQRYSRTYKNFKKIRQFLELEQPLRTAFADLQDTDVRDRFDLVFCHNDMSCSNLI